MAEEQILIWDKSSSGSWSYSYQPWSSKLLVFELPRIPNFAEPRYKELGEKIDERVMEIARRQMVTLRQLYSLAHNTRFTLRFYKDEDRLRLFVLFRVSTDQMILEQLTKQIQPMFPKEYDFKPVIQDENPSLWEKATDLNWSRFIEEIIKLEERFRSPIPEGIPYFYVASLFYTHAKNSMEGLCRSLLLYQGKAVVDVLLVPTNLNQNEQEWLGYFTKEINEAYRGKRLLDDDGKLIKQYEPIHELKLALDNNEDQLKRYNSTNFLYLYAFRILSNEDPSIITSAFSTNCTRSKSQIYRYNEDDPEFSRHLQSAMNLELSPECLTNLWKSEKDLPWRAQRFHRIVDLDEAAPFWRIPIPVKAGFPGFPLDIGHHLGEKFDEYPEKRKIELGTFSDENQFGKNSEFDREGLIRHGLIVGVPGSGKTTCMLNLLHQLWCTSDGQERIPFIVLEPAKTEYRALKTLDGFNNDLLVFTLGDERISPFRFNPFEVPKGTPLESHISRLNACFVGAFNLFDPLPLLLDKSIRRMYEAHGWFEDSMGGDSGVGIPNLSSLITHANQVIKESGYSDNTLDDFNAALLQRLESLCRGSKGRMLNTKKSIPFNKLMEGPVILELDSLNGDEKALMMMFILSFVYEYSRATRKSGSRLKHLIVIEEAHNLIGRGDQTGYMYRANPKEHAIRLFVQMLAEMRALGEGIVIADQLPTAIAPEAIKQTNVKILMRMTSKDDREEIGNTMDVNEAELKDVIRLKCGQAYVYLDEWDRVRRLDTFNFKGNNFLDEPPDDEWLSRAMDSFEQNEPTLFMPFPDCSLGCTRCDRRTRNQAEKFIRSYLNESSEKLKNSIWMQIHEPFCTVVKNLALGEAVRLKQTYGEVNHLFIFCAFLHSIFLNPDLFGNCERRNSNCMCKDGGITQIIESIVKDSNDIKKRLKKIAI